MMTSLILSPEYDIPYTITRETDTRTAVVRGLAEYLRTLSITTGSGSLALKSVDYEIPESENEASFPSAYVLAMEPFQYEYRALTPTVEMVGDGYHIRETGQVEVPLVVGVRATNPAMRRALAMMFEEAFDPVDWMSGFRLRLPHYHDVVAEYALDSGQYSEDADEAQKRWRDLSYRLTGRIVKLKWVGEAPELNIDFQAEVT